MERSLYDRLTATVPTLAQVVPERRMSVPLAVGEKEVSAILSGTTPQMLALLRDARAADIARGRFLTDKDVKFNEPVAVVSASLAEALFGGDDPVGRMVTLEGTPVRIVGVLASSSSPLAASAASQVYVPLTTLDRIAPAADAEVRVLSRLWLEVARFEQVEQTTEIVEAITQRAQRDGEISVQRAW
jgi:hypothetical protein